MGRFERDAPLANVARGSILKHVHSGIGYLIGWCVLAGYFNHPQRPLCVANAQLYNG